MALGDFLFGRSSANGEIDRLEGEVGRAKTDAADNYVAYSQMKQEVARLKAENDQLRARLRTARNEYHVEAAISTAARELLATTFKNEATERANAAASSMWSRALEIAQIVRKGAWRDVRSDVYSPASGAFGNKHCPEFEPVE